MPIKIKNLEFIQANATDLKGIPDNTVASLSSLHAIEHFGLGRYGDGIDPAACFTAMRSFQRVLQKDGRLYFSVPIGKQDSVYFNSHRIFSLSTILDSFDKMDLIEFSYIHNYEIRTFEGVAARALIEEDAISIEDYDCGIFIFSKR